MSNENKNPDNATGFNFHSAENENYADINTNTEKTTTEPPPQNAAQISNFDLGRDDTPKEDDPARQLESVDNLMLSVTIASNALRKNPDSPEAETKLREVLKKAEADLPTNEYNAVYNRSNSILNPNSSSLQQQAGSGGISLSVDQLFRDFYQTSGKAIEKTADITKTAGGKVVQGAKALSNSEQAASIKEAFLNAPGKIGNHLAMRELAKNLSEKSTPLNKMDVQQLGAELNNFSDSIEKQVSKINAIPKIEEINKKIEASQSIANKPLGQQRYNEALQQKMQFISSNADASNAYSSIKELSKLQSTTLKEVEKRVHSASSPQELKAAQNLLTNMKEKATKKGEGYSKQGLEDLQKAQEEMAKRIQEMIEKIVERLSSKQSQSNSPTN